MLHKHHFPSTPPSCLPPLSPPPPSPVPVARLRRRPPHMMLVFSRFSPKKEPFEDTTEAVVVLAVGDDGQRGGEVGWGVGGVVGGVSLVVRQVEEGATNKDLDDDNDAMDVAPDKDDAIVHATVGWHPPPPPLLAWWSGRGSCRATMTTGRPPPPPPPVVRKNHEGGGRGQWERATTTRAVVVGRGRKGAGRPAGPLRWRRLPSQTRSWWPTSVRSRTSDALLPSLSRPPGCRH